MSTPLLRTGVCPCDGKGYFKLADGNVPCPRCTNRRRMIRREEFHALTAGERYEEALRHGRNGMKPGKYADANWNLTDGQLARKFGVTPEAVRQYRKRWASVIERKRAAGV